MKTFSCIIHPFALVLLLAARTAVGQGTLLGPGTFRNLDFESANVRDLPTGVGEFVSETDGIPGWTSEFSADHMIAHNDISLGGAIVVLYGPQWQQPDQILAGKYSLGLYTDFQGTGAISVWQTGQIPAAAQSLLFYAKAPAVMTVSFAGHDLPFVDLSSHGKYDIYGADVSGYAGETGELRFTAVKVPPYVAGGTILDNFQFSPQIVPEPSTSILMLGGLLLLGRLSVWRRDAATVRRTQ